MILPYRVRRWFLWREWRHLYRRLRGYFVRGWRGWADHDTWGLDSYLAGILAGALRHLAENKHGCPVDFYEKYGDRGHAEWQVWLYTKADWFEWYHKDEDGTSDDKGWIAPGMSRQERDKRIQAYHAKMERFQYEMLDFMKHYRDLWD